MRLVMLARNPYPLNECVAIGHSRGRLRALQMLDREGIGLPATAFAHGLRKAEDVIKEVDGVAFVVKLLEDTQGMGVTLAETEGPPNRRGRAHHRLRRGESLLW